MTIFLSDKQLASRYSISRITLWRWCREGKFPQPVKIGPNTTRWNADRVAAWEANKTAQIK